MNYSFQIVSLADLDIEEYNSSPQKSVFTTLPWIQYIEEDAKAKPIIIRITDDSRFIGYFSGLMFRKFGVKIIGSPFNGWSTCYMGLDLIGYDNRLDIVEQLKDYLFNSFKCKYIEITDRYIAEEDAKERGITCLPMNTLELIIDRTDEELFKAFKTDARNFIRQFERRGATIEEALPDDTFAEEYYFQLQDVFAKQHLVPTYSLEKVKTILSHMKGTEELLCLRVRNPEGNSIATSIFFGFKDKFFFWGGASLRPEQHYRPNEYMIWTAIRYWRERGCKVFDMVGVRDYKRKFGAEEKHYVKLVFTKYKILLHLRNMAKYLFFSMGKIKGKLSGKK